VCWKFSDQRSFNNVINKLSESFLFKCIQLKHDKILNKLKYFSRSQSQSIAVERISNRNISFIFLKWNEIKHFKESLYVWDIHLSLIAAIRL